MEQKDSYPSSTNRYWTCFKVIDSLLQELRTKSWKRFDVSITLRQGICIRQRIYNKIVVNKYIQQCEKGPIIPIFKNSAYYFYETGFDHDNVISVNMYGLFIH